MSEATNSSFGGYPDHKGQENRRRIRNLNDLVARIEQNQQKIDKRTEVTQNVMDRIEMQTKWMTNLMVGNLIALVLGLIAGIITLVANLA